jgi:hypothetical protein
MNNLREEGDIFKVPRDCLQHAGVQNCAHQQTDPEQIRDSINKGPHSDTLLTIETNDKEMWDPHMYQHV